MNLKGVVTYSLNSSSNDSIRLGATRAQQDFTALRDALVRDLATATEPIPVVIDFSGVAQTNTSYVRNSLYWLHACGRCYLRPELAPSSQDAWAVRPLPIIPLARNLAPEVREVVDEVFYVRSSPCLEITLMKDATIQSTLLLGALEGTLFSTLKQVSAWRKETVTATELHQKHSSEDVGVTAWNNRLAELHALLLLRRQRQGKFWHYQPLNKEIKDGRGPRT